MNINNLGGINRAGAQSATASTTAAAVSAATAKPGADQTMFLKLLVAQMKNQDPLSPQDSTQYVTQLAQFSSLEQLTGINQKLTNLLDLGKK